MHMYVIVVGAGRLGYYLTKILIEEHHDTVVIDKQGDRCKEIANKTGVLAIRGDSTEPEILEHAGIKTADVLAAVTGSDETNIIICLLAKSMGAKKVKEIPYPKGSAIIAIYEEGNMIIAEPSTKLKAGDKLLVLTKKDVAKDINRLLAQKK